MRSLVALVVAVVIVVVVGSAGSEVGAQAGDAVAPDTSSVIAFANVLVVNVSGSSVTVTVADHTEVVPDQTAGHPFRLPSGTVGVAVAGRELIPVELVGGCTDVLLVPAVGDGPPIVPIAECPPRRASSSISATVRTIDAAPHASSIETSVGGARTSATAPFAASDRIAVPSGPEMLAVVPTGRSGVIQSVAADLVAGHGYAVVLEGGGERPVSAFVIEDAGSQAADPPSVDVPINTGIVESSGARSPWAMFTDVGALKVGLVLMAFVFGLLRHSRARRFGSTR